MNHHSIHLAHNREDRTLRLLPPTDFTNFTADGEALADFLYTSIPSPTVVICQQKLADLKGSFSNKDKMIIVEQRKQIADLEAVVRVQRRSLAAATRDLRNWYTKADRIRKHLDPRGMFPESELTLVQLSALRGPK